MRIADVIEVDIKTADGHTYRYIGKGAARQIETEVADGKHIPVHYISLTMSIADGTVFTPGVGISDALPPRPSDGRPVAEEPVDQTDNYDQTVGEINLGTPR